MTLLQSGSPLDALLADAASVLLRNKRRRPTWLPPGYPMKLILTQKRRQLLGFLLAEPTLRQHLRSSNRLVDPDLTDGVSADSFDTALADSRDPQRMVATALLAPDDDLVRVAVEWAAEPDRIPAGPPRPAPTATPKRALQSRHRPPPAVLPPPTASEPIGVVEPPEVVGSPIDVKPFTSDLAPIEPEMAPGPEPDLHVACAEENNRLRRRIARLETEAAGLRAAIPTRNERRRRNRQSGELARLREQLEERNTALEALQEERDELLGIRHCLEDQLEEAEEARVRAQRKAGQLESQLRTTEGRAGYLQRMVERDLEALLAEQAQLARGPDLTRITRKIGLLEGLRAALVGAFPPPPKPELPRRLVVGRETLAMVVDPLGGGEEIGGSAILVEAGGKRILVDVGMHPDGRGPLRIDEICDGRPLDAIVLTHAHNDHAGFVPAMVDRFRNTPIYCSAATAHLLPTMWADSAKVMKRAFEEAVESDKAVPPHYGRAEVEQAEDRVQPRSYDRRFNVGDLGLTLFQAGHILGAAGLIVEAGDKRLVITGDISGLDEHYLSVEPAHLPSGLVRDADLLVIETTYCHEDHANRRLQAGGLVDTVSTVVDRRGRVLIPAFGLGRSQEVIMILAEALPDVDVLVDGLAREISTIYEQVGAEAGKPVRILDGRVRPVQNRFREIQSFHSGVVVTTSGMLTGGPSVQWAKEILPDERAALLLCGYQDEEAPGRRLEELAGTRNRARTLTLPDPEFGTVDVAVKADVRRYILSAHADKRGLLDIISMVAPKATMLVHGERRRQAEFRAVLRSRGDNVVPTARVEL